MIHIGIDPDTEKSGVACWDSELKAFDYIKTMSFWEIIEEFALWNIPFKVHIEAGWLIKKSNWHANKKQSKIVGEKIAKNVGSNHQVGILLKEYCEHNNIEYRLVKPKGKLNAKTFKNITGYEDSTNPEKRDAGMLVFGL